jgi:predicted nucleic acid-binding protein
VNYLLDVSVLVAWGWADHLDHKRTVDWIAAARKHVGSTRLSTSAIPQLGFVRVSVQRAAGRLQIDDAARVLAGLIKSLGNTHSFLEDDQSAALSFPSWCQSASRTTDAHLVQLADKHGFTLATLDVQIPGAFLIPELPV